MKRLENALDSEEILNGLDTNTLLLQPEDPAPGELFPWSGASSLPSHRYTVVVVLAGLQPKHL